MTKEIGDSLGTLSKELNKEYGEGTIVDLDNEDIFDVETISTGSLVLDDLTGIGGIPCGRVTEIFGSEGCGKTTICSQTVVQAQKMGKRCLYLDTEHTVDLRYMKSMGVDLKTLIFSRPAIGEDVMTIIKRYVEEDLVGLVVLDSVAQMTTKAESEGDIGDANMGGKARLMGQTLRLLSKPLFDHNVALILVNQVRDKIGITFGSPKTTPGGKALAFACSLRIDMTKLKKINGDKAILTKAEIVKNKLACPFAKGELTIVLGKGTIIEQEMVEIGVEKNLWTKGGAWYKIDEETKFQGSDKLVEYLTDLRSTNNELYKQYLSTCRG